MSELYIPTLSHWKLGNNWSGSQGRASYHVKPRTREEGEEKIPELFAEIWLGPLCYELSQPERTATFPVSEEGLEALRGWLSENLVEAQKTGL